jgi:uncharacterized FAD-dependent dehydrogenase
VGELTNMLGNGHILVQRFGDILDGKRTWQGAVAPTSAPRFPDAVAGDITAAMPYRAMINIINFIQAWIRWCRALPPRRDAAVFAGAEVLQQQGQDGHGSSTPISAASTAWAIPPAGRAG